jgi:DNA-binding NarL/FixJ family response regulator
MIKLLIADDHLIVRHELATLLDAEPDIVVIGEAADGREVIDLLQSGVCPDVVIADIKMPRIDGITLAQYLTETFPAVKLIILTTRTEKVFKEQALHAGAKGYVVKLKVDEPGEAIRRVFEGNTYF